MIKQRFCWIWILCLSSYTLLTAQSGYQTPPQAMVDLANAPLTPLVSVDSKGARMVFLERSEAPTIEELSQPELRLAGLRINPQTNGPSRATSFIGMSLGTVGQRETSAVKGLPANVNISYVQWSPDERKVAFANTTSQGIELWVLDVASAQAQRVGNLMLNAVLGAPFEWMPDNQQLICKLVLPSRGQAPKRSSVPEGPVIQENIGKKAPARTYQDLLKNPDDEALFAYYATAQAALVNIANGNIKNIGAAGLVLGASPSPDGRYILLETITQPFSYLVPYYRFPMKVEIRTVDDQAVKTLAQIPLQENIPTGFNAVQTGPRNHGWRADAPAVVYWVEAQDEGDPRKQVSIRDKVFALNAPFDGQPQLLAQTTLRFQDILWGDNQTALCYENWWANRQQIVRLIDPSGKATAKVIFDRSYEDTYNDPGTPELRKNAQGRRILALDKNRNLWMTGKGASPEGDRPFVDLLNLNSLKTQRLWRSEAPYFEQPVAILDFDKQLVLTSRESPKENPNYFVRDLKKRNLTQTTFFPHPYPEYKDLEKQVLRYQRNDGVELTADLYLPLGYKKEDGPLPTFIWAYPREYKDKNAAGQVNGSPYQFVRLSIWGAIPFVTQGYAVLDNTSMPIVGEGNAQPNDSFVAQLVANVQAVIDEGVRLGVVDPNRVGAGGHSYGAFMTANLLAHSDLLRAGIARSGAYNRTLTPFGFQAEERTYWEAPEVYNTMSPFMNAHKINEPLLLIHGEADNNSGTFPIQSERLYNALKGLGATTRLVMLPHESHGYRAKESLMHMLWEMHQWLETYVKNAPKTGN
jgi:dipeptidyl aminopeptidase/acylaminoacyl peptidase